MSTFAAKARQKSAASLTRSNSLPTSARQSVNPVLHLARIVSNQALLPLDLAGSAGLEAGSDNEVGATSEVRSETQTTTCSAHEFSRIPVHAPAPITIQPKLTVNTPGDRYEQEADDIAERVMRMSEPKLQRGCACGGGCAKCQTEQPAQEHQRLQAKPVGPIDSGQMAAPPLVHEVLASPGQPLDESTLAFMEPRFGHDFRQVRVHTDEKAQDSARAVNALAYTAGRHLVFGVGQYSPATPSGRGLLAHELAHAVQQGFASNLPPSVAGSSRNVSERRAEKAADVIYRKEDKNPPTGCRTVLTQRWGCDTACSRAGFVDHDTPLMDQHGEKGMSGIGCCNKWPPFVESFAITNLGLNGVASCKGAMYKKIFKVSHKIRGREKENEVRIACTDATTRDADHDLELSPAASRILFERDDFPKNSPVTICPDGALSSVCEPDPGKGQLNNPNNPKFPRQIDCIEKGCIPQDNEYDCSRTGWPPGS
jgi:Domain of unknown function (DUF4157)